MTEYTMIQIAKNTHRDLKGFLEIETEYGIAKIAIRDLVSKVMEDWMNKKREKVSE